MRTKYKIILLALLLGCLVWFLDAWLDYAFFYRGEGSLWDLLAGNVPGHELYIRTVILAFFLIFGLVMARVVAKLEKSHQENRESGEWFATTLRSIGDAVIATDEQGRVTFLNSAAIKLTGWDADSALGRPCREIFRIINEETREPVDDPVSLVIREGKVVGLANHTALISRDGREIPIEDSGAPIMRDGRLIGVVLVFHDIIERQRALAALRRSEERNRRILTTAMDGFWRVDTQGRLLEINDAYCRMSGYDRQELLAMCISDLEMVQADEDIADQMKGIMEQGEARFESRHRAKDGRPFDLDIAIQFLPDDQGGQCVCFLRDITESKRAEEEIRRSELRFRAGFEHAPVGMAMIDTERKFTQVNDMLCQSLGYTPEELLGRSFNRFTHPDDRQGGRDRWRRLLAGEETFNRAEKRYLNRDGQVIWALVSNSLIRGGDGEPLYILSHLVDITERKRAEEALAWERQRLTNIVEGTNAGTWEWNVQTGETVFNDQWARIIGYTLDELEPCSLETWTKFVHPDDLERSNRRLEQYFSGQSDYYECEVRMRHKDGHWIWVLDRGKVSTRTPDGRPLRMFGTHLDVTERKKVEEELRKSEEDLKESQRIAKLGSWRLDLVTNEVRWTEELYEMYGFDPSLPPPPYTEHMKLFTPESWELLSASLDRTVETGAPYELELETVRTDGGRGWMWVRGEAITDDRGRTTGLWGAAQDISERKLTEAALADREEKFYSLFNSMTELAVLHELVFGPDGEPVDYRLLDCNRAFTRITGITSEQAIGALASEVYGTGQAPYLDIYAPVAMTGEPSHFETYFEPMKKHFSVSAFATGQGRFATISEDITFRKKAEEERIKLEGQLAQAQKMEALGTLAGGIAHDFNNILAAIMGYSELALDKAEAGEGPAGEVRHILASAERAKDLVTQILTFSRKVESELKPIGLNDVVYQTEQMLERTIPRMVEIEHHLSDDIWPINADPSQMIQVLMNLCTNASDAMPDGGKLVIETSNVTLDKDYADQHAEARPGDYVQLTVSDTGQGMDRETQAHIFDPFFTKKEIGQGTGLGLATVYGILKNHGGHIMCYSEVGRGTTFKAYLPALRGEVESAPGHGVVEDEIQGGTETILLVDDEAAIRDLGRRVLGGQGYRVVTAKNGEEALELYGQSGSDIDLVILDISMPGMGGHKCLKELLKFNPEAKVIISSGYSLPGHLSDIIDQGASGFVPKPFSKKEMLKTVRRVLSE